MKLATKFSLIYLLVSVIVLAAGGFISYYVIKQEVDKELRWRFKDRIDRVTKLMKKGRDFGFDDPEMLEKTHSQNLTIRELKGSVESRTVVSDTMAWHPYLKRMVPNIKVTAYRTINGQSYLISTYGVLVESDDIIEAVVKSLSWILGLLIIGGIGVGLMVSRQVFKPFRQTLEKIKSFTLKDKKPIQTSDSNVREFQELNTFIEQMTRKAIADYTSLKQFSENASHELKTPLSIARGKLELLAETELSSEQHQYVESTQRAIRKLSRLSESLGLLTKIENQEFTASEQINFSQLVQDSLESFEELINLKGLSVETHIEPEVRIRIHPTLAEILWSNLLQNSIKHNVDNGYISIELDHQRLSLSNPGPPLQRPTEDLFERFKKDDQSSDSIGLGLSIIQRIADQYQFEIEYNCKNQVHTLKIFFNNNSSET